MKKRRRRQQWREQQQQLSLCGGNGTAGDILRVAAVTSLLLLLRNPPCALAFLPGPTQTTTTSYHDLLRRHEIVVIPPPADAARGSCQFWCWLFPRSTGRRTSPRNSNSRSSTSLFASLGDLGSSLLNWLATNPDPTPLDDASLDLLLEPPTNNKKKKPQPNQYPTTARTRKSDDADSLDSTTNTTTTTTNTTTTPTRSRPQVGLEQALQGPPFFFARMVDESQTAAAAETVAKVEEDPADKDDDETSTTVRTVAVEMEKKKSRLSSTTTTNKNLDDDKTKELSSGRSSASDSPSFVTTTTTITPRQAAAVRDRVARPTTVATAPPPQDENHGGGKSSSTSSSGSSSSPSAADDDLTTPSSSSARNSMLVRWAALSMLNAATAATATATATGKDDDDESKSTSAATTPSWSSRGQPVPLSATTTDPEEPPPPQQQLGGGGGADVVEEETSSVSPMDRKLLVRWAALRVPSSFGGSHDDYSLSTRTTTTTSTTEQPPQQQQQQQQQPQRRGAPPSWAWSPPFDSSLSSRQKKKKTTTTTTNNQFASPPRKMVPWAALQIPTEAVAASIGTSPQDNKEGQRQSDVKKTKLPSSSSSYAPFQASWKTSSSTKGQAPSSWKNDASSYLETLPFVSSSSSSSSLPSGPMTAGMRSSSSTPPAVPKSDNTDVSRDRIASTAGSAAAAASETTREEAVRVRPDTTTTDLKATTTTTSRVGSDLRRRQGAAAKQKHDSSSSTKHPKSSPEPKRPTMDDDVGDKSVITTASKTSSVPFTPSTLEPGWWSYAPAASNVKQMFARRRKQTADVPLRSDDGLPPPSTTTSSANTTAGTTTNLLLDENQTSTTATVEPQQQPVPSTMANSTTISSGGRTDERLSDPLLDGSRDAIGTTTTTTTRRKVTNASSATPSLALAANNGTTTTGLAGAPAPKDYKDSESSHKNDTSTKGVSSILHFLGAAKKKNDSSSMRPTKKAKVQRQRPATDGSTTGLAGAPAPKKDYKDPESTHKIDDTSNKGVSSILHFLGAAKKTNDSSSMTPTKKAEVQGGRQRHQDDMGRSMIPFASALESGRSSSDAPDDLQQKSDSGVSRTTASDDAGGASQGLLTLAPRSLAAAASQLVASTLSIFSSSPDSETVKLTSGSTTRNGAALFGDGDGDIVTIDLLTTNQKNEQVAQDDGDGDDAIVWCDLSYDDPRRFIPTKTMYQYVDPPDPAPVASAVSLPGGGLLSSNQTENSSASDGALTSQSLMDVDMARLAARREPHFVAVGWCAPTVNEDGYHVLQKPVMWTKMAALPSCVMPAPSNNQAATATLHHNLWGSNIAGSFVSIPNAAPSRCHLGVRAVCKWGHS